MRCAFCAMRRALCAMRKKEAEMFKRIIFILAITIFFCFGFGLGLRAQRYPEEETVSPDFSEGFTQIEAKIDKLSLSLDKTDKEILKKLDQVLSNQEKIFKELEIIKIRASR